MAAILRRIEEQAGMVVGDMEERPLALRLRLQGRSRHHARLLSMRQDLRDEAQAAVHRCHQDIWLEKLEFRIQPPEASLGGDAMPFDLTLLVDDVTDEAEAVIRDILQKMPRGTGAGDNPLEVETAELLAEARALLLARSGGEAA